MIKINKLDLLENSKTFCMYPWIHLHTTPSGRTAPCCIAKSCTDDYALNPNDYNLMELVNSDMMKTLRLDMLKGVQNPECENCYKHEKQNICSSRKSVNKDFGKYFDEAIIASTNLEDGSLKQFKMRYFDIRFSNICNFKCRTCGLHYSSQWEQEDIKHSPIHVNPIPKNNNKEFLQNVLDQIPYMDTAYFAGGEPLITEEHYILLEEMIRLGRTNIQLKYNTNLSNLRFKSKDLLSIWKNFKMPIQIYASIDHYGERAEYLRHGTDWGVIESNFLTIKQQSNINLSINTVLSAFNLLTIDKFYNYLIDKGMYYPTCDVYSLYPMATPTHLSCHILPMEYKDQAKIKLQNCVDRFTKENFTHEQTHEFVNGIRWIYSENTWEREKFNFFSEVNRLDRIRGENFSKVFPELAPLYESMKPQRRPLPTI